MFRSALNLMRLARAGRVLARHDALFPLELRGEMPGPLILLMALAKIRMPWERREAAIDGAEPAVRLAAALMQLGPSYIKLGQFLATRPDIIGAELATDLTQLQDKLPPFPTEEARAIVEAELGQPLSKVFSSFSDAIAAASIAQVHRARTMPDEANPEGRDVAVKVLRPGIEASFGRDLDSFFWIAELVERVHAPARRLRPVESVQTLADSVKTEMDFRLEAAAMSEMAENVANDQGFRVPKVEWELTARHVLTLEWIDGIPASDRAALVAAGHDMKKLGTQVIQSFLMHALRDGFFHADMHQGNHFVDADGTLVAVDFGIMGRLDEMQRRTMAEILYGFIRRDYRRVAEIHFQVGFVPHTKSIDAFAQALRAIGEPIFGRSARDVSMGRLLAQLFQVTEQFDMRTRPELILLQKTMVVIEGVSRHFDPDHNIWESAEPVLKAWMMEQFAPETRIEEAAAGAMQLGRLAGNLPDFLVRAERTARLLSESVDEEGLKLHPSSTERLARAQNRRAYLPALWAIAGALLAIALFRFF
ncbi:MAG: 2-polyprenylphenol 6-hydroxylase [Parvibaculum sp.]|uniref:2-polyprenylphenol 6-hydroxylase n=1 Tax=Parvibaculum sp. TaxID=2024848 RepID=UPI002843B573|nr:2-polyprenylphenol 6-hydroxylase [Parvibaculum sp.]MDR3500766.1 2-polyprenylphenol 6-hydroxylase [Parvibaculum sp.]